MAATREAWEGGALMPLPMPHRGGRPAVVTLQRRHFELMADVLADCRRGAACNASGEEVVNFAAVVAAFADRLSRTNAQFRGGQFRERCFGSGQ